jgi:MoxR-like ATPase
MTISRQKNMMNEIDPIFQQSSALLKRLEEYIGQIIVGNQNTIELILTALIAHGHVLVEGAPGIAKTTLVKTLANALDIDFKRIQFTPDLLPSDLIGASIYNPKKQEFEIKKGPLFAHVILADEINRAPAKVQAALLEAMQERQVTISAETFKLDEPFFVFATQNPLEQQGTYPLPEAQIDRFMFKLLMHYPSMHDEKLILKKSQVPYTSAAFFNKSDLIKIQELSKKIYIDDRVVDYIVRIVDATRNPEHHGLKELKKYILHGASPRATLSLYQGAQAQALLKGRSFATPDDIKKIATAVLRHRIIPTYQAEADEYTVDAIINTIMQTLPTP